MVKKILKKAFKKHRASKHHTTTSFSKPNSSICNNHSRKGHIVNCQHFAIKKIWVPKNSMSLSTNPYGPKMRWVPKSHSSVSNVQNCSKERLIEDDRENHQKRTYQVLRARPPRLKSPHGDMLIG